VLKRAADLLRITVQTLFLDDGDLITACPQCKTQLTLANASTAEERGVTVYRCRRDQEIVALITPPGTVPVESSGYRLGDFVLRNRSDLILPLVSGNKVLLPASTNALHDWESLGT
jgi:hypothetical protein